MIKFGTGYIQIILSWTEFKTILLSKKLKIQYVINTNSESHYYEIFAVDEHIAYITLIFKNNIPGNYKTTQAENDISKDDFEAHYVSISNKRLSTAMQDNEAILVAPAGREGTEFTITTPNFCDKTTWYSSSERCNDITLTSIDGGTSFSLSGSDECWVDLYHGKILIEPEICNEKSHKYEIIVTVDNIVKTMREPFDISGGDYEVDYLAGTVIFFTPQINSIVKASYNKVIDSKFYLMPKEGKYLDVEDVEVQFTSDVTMKDRIVFEIQGYVQYFAPQLCDLYGGPYPANTLIPLQKTWYDTFYQLIDEALGSYPVIPAIGGSAGRGTLHSTYGFPMRYATVRRMNHSYGLRSCVYLNKDIPFEGERSTATFYCVQNSES